MHILAFSGSLRTGSFNTQLITFAAKLLKERGAEVDLWDFRAANVPVYDPDTSDTHPVASMVDFKARVARADGVLLSSPEYNYSIPGSLKNLFDYASRPPKDNPFRGKVAGQLGATPGPGGTLQGQVAIRHVLGYGLQTFTVPAQFTLSKANEAFDATGALKDEGQVKQLGAYLDRFVELVKVHAAKK